MQTMPLRLVRHGRFLAPSQRMKLRLHRMSTGNLLFADGMDIAGPVIAYVVRALTLPFAFVGDWLTAPVLRLIDRGERPWWVVEVRFHGWDAEFVRLSESPTRLDAESKLWVARPRTTE